MNKKKYARLFRSNTSQAKFSFKIQHNHTDCCVLCPSSHYYLLQIVVFFLLFLLSTGIYNVPGISFQLYRYTRYAQIFVLLTSEWILFTDQNANYYWSRFYIAHVQEWRRKKVVGM